MADRNVDRSFDAVEAIMAQAGIAAVGRQVQGHVNELAEFLEQYLAPIFSDLGGMIAENLRQIPGEWGAPKWAALNPEYEAFSKPQHLGFAHFGGDSHRAISNLDPARVFGRPKVTGQLSVGSQKYNFIVDAGKRVRFAAGSRDATGTALGGRFAALAEFKKIKARVEMVPPARGKFLGGNITQGWLEKNVTQEFAAFEYGAPKRKTAQPARPLMIPYLKWKLGPQLDTELKKRFRM